MHFWLVGYSTGKKWSPSWSPGSVDLENASCLECREIKNTVRLTVRARRWEEIKKSGERA